MNGLRVPYQETFPGEIQQKKLTRKPRNKRFGGLGGARLLHLIHPLVRRELLLAAHKVNGVAPAVGQMSARTQLAWILDAESETHQ